MLRQQGVVCSLDRVAQLHLLHGIETKRFSTRPVRAFAPKQMRLSAQRTGFRAAVKLRLGIPFNMNCPVCHWRILKPSFCCSLPTGTTLNSVASPTKRFTMYSRNENPTSLFHLVLRLQTFYISVQTRTYLKILSRAAFITEIPRALRAPPLFKGGEMLTPLAKGGRRPRGF